MCSFYILCPPHLRFSSSRNTWSSLGPGTFPTSLSYQEGQGIPNHFWSFLCFNACIASEKLVPEMRTLAPPPFPLSTRPRFLGYHVQKLTHSACLFFLSTFLRILVLHTHPGLSLWFSSSAEIYRKQMMSFNVPESGPYVPSCLLVPATASSLSSYPSLYRLNPPHTHTLCFQR